MAENTLEIGLMESNTEKVFISHLQGRGKKVNGRKANGKNGMVKMIKDLRITNPVDDVHIYFTIQLY